MVVGRVAAVGGSWAGGGAASGPRTPARWLMVDGLRREWSRSTAERSAVESASSINLLAVIMCRADALLPVALAEQLDLNKGC